MPCERDMKYIDQLPNGYVFVEAGDMAPTTRIMAYPTETLDWDSYEGMSHGLRYDPKKHRVMAYLPDKPIEREW